MLTKRLRTGYDIYNIQSEHVVYRTYSQQPINSFLPILKVMCGMNPKNPANFTRGLFNKGENNTLWLQGTLMYNFSHFIQYSAQVAQALCGYLFILFFF
jgi:hypothetical protein